MHNVTLSLDGYAAGPDQSLQDPIGVGGHRLHEWLFATRTFRQTFDMEGGEDGPDDAFVTKGALRAEMPIVPSAGVARMGRTSQPRRAFDTGAAACRNPPRESVRSAKSKSPKSVRGVDGPQWT